MVSVGLWVVSMGISGTFQRCQEAVTDVRGSEVAGLTHIRVHWGTVVSGSPT